MMLDPNDLEQPPPPPEEHEPSAKELLFYSLFMHANGIGVMIFIFWFWTSFWGTNQLWVIIVTILGLKAMLELSFTASASWSLFIERMNMSDNKDDDDDNDHNSDFGA